MPIIKTEILGNIVEINYEKEEKDRLEHIINKFNDRILDFKNLEGKISDAKILYLAALKAEDEVADLLKQKIEEKDKKKLKIPKEMPSNIVSIGSKQVFWLYLSTVISFYSKFCLEYTWLILISKRNSKQNLNLDFIMKLKYSIILLLTIYC